MGWPLLAQAMADVPALESFSRFRELNIRSLLYYHVQLHHLQDELRTMEQRALHKQDPATNWAEDLVKCDDPMPVLESPTSATGRKKVSIGSLNVGNDCKDSELYRHWQLIVKIRDILEKYST